MCEWAAVTSCSACRHENPAGTNFCGQCGARLAARCAACGASNRPDNKFCGECGSRLGPSANDPRFTSPEAYTPKHLAEKILVSRAALEGERKQVTVLFADIKGSMELLVDRDPEEAQRLMDPVLDRMIEAVHRYEGTVNQVMGDGIMALFGAPLAHEDHAVRACYAALRMQEQVNAYADDARRNHGVPVQIRVGLNSGEVVVGAIGSDLHMDYTAIGQTTHLAARMEQIANPGSILVTPSTLDLAEGHVTVKALGRVPVKGLAGPVDVHELTGAGAARTRFQVSARRGLTRFVGRDAELEQLHRAAQLAEKGHGQLAAIVGEAGVGKSRLVYEFTHSARLQGWQILESASVSYGKATSYLPVIDLLKRYFKIEDRDGLGEIRTKITGKLLNLDESLEPTLPAFLTLFDVPVDDDSWRLLDPAQRRHRTLQAVRRLLLREAHEQPLLVIFEDLHWIDAGTQMLLDGLVESLALARLLLLVNYRPEYQHAWAGKTYYSQLRLDALLAENGAELLEVLLGDDPGLLPLKQLLVRRGNPFFLEETVRTLVETRALVGERGRYSLTQPVHAVQVPATVHAILAARIDRLASEDKHLLQVASVVGKDVPLNLLQGIADVPEEALRAGLDRLQSAEFVYETGLYPELQYSFKHALTHEVTYGGLLHARRRQLHGRIVEAIEHLHRERLSEQVERLAHHAVRGELGEAAGHYLRQAGLKAAARSALEDARTWFGQALSVLDGLPESSTTLEQGFEIRLELRPVLNLLGEAPVALERMREAGKIAERLDDDHRRARVSALVTNSYALLGDLDEAVASGSRALDIAQRLGDLRLQIFTTTYLEQAHYYRGDYERVVELARGNLKALPPEWVHERFGLAGTASVYDRHHLVVSLAQLGQFDAAAEHDAAAREVADATHHPFTEGLAYYAAGLLQLLEGNWAAAKRPIEHVIATARTGNVVLQLPRAVAASAWLLAQLGERSEALSRFQEGVRLLDANAARGVVGNLGWVYHALCRAALLLDRLDDAQRLVDRAVESLTGQVWFAASASHLLGDIATSREGGDVASAETHYGKSLALARARGMRPLVAHCHLGLGNLYRRTGRARPAAENIAIAAGMYAEMGMSFWAEETARMGEGDAERI